MKREKTREELEQAIKFNKVLMKIFAVLYSMFLGLFFYVQYRKSFDISIWDCLGVISGGITLLVLFWSNRQLSKQIEEKR